MNLLILSAGTRCGIVRYFRQALRGEGRVVAADADPLSPALFEADVGRVVPPIGDPGYLSRVLSICSAEQISGVLSLIDPELSLLAANAERFAALGVQVIGSSCELCELALDKRRMYRWLAERGYPCARFWCAASFGEALAAGDVGYPVFIKPAKGSASLDCAAAWNGEDAAYLLRRREDMLAQEYFTGPEIGADVYVDLISGEPVSVFTRRKLRMRAGETDRAVSFKDGRLFAFLRRFVSECGFRGELDVDLFERDGAFFITDVNPRFGGGYPHAHLSGCDHIRMIVENLKGKANPPRIGAYEEGICMMKYNEVRLTSDAAGCSGGVFVGRKDIESC